MIQEAKYLISEIKKSREVESYKILELIAVILDKDCDRTTRQIIQAFVYRLYSPFIYKVIHENYSSLSAEQKEDILQESWIKIFKNLDKCEVKFKNWIATITKNTSIDYYRSKGKKDKLTTNIPDLISHETLEFEISSGEGVFLNLLRGERSEYIQNQIEKLPVKSERENLGLWMQNIPYEEMCEITGLKLGTVKSSINRAKTKIGKTLPGEFGEF
jgi:RNA polymerase sigma-70 factor, ECF subfamily